MKKLEVKQEINILHVQKLTMKDKGTGQEITYFEYGIEAPLLFSSLEKATSGAEFKIGKQIIKLLISAKGDELKLRIAKPEAGSK